VFNAADPATSGGYATVSSACSTITPIWSDQIISGAGNCRIILRTWSASNVAGTANCTQTITVIDTILPVLVGVPKDTIVDACKVPVVASVTATDNCTIPFPGVTYSEFSSQEPDSALCGHYDYLLTRVWTITDGCNSAVKDTQYIEVQDTLKPVFAIPNPLIINTEPNSCTANVSVNLWNYISDCAPDRFLTITNNAPHGNGSNMISGIYTSGDYSVKVRATDPCGNIDSATFVLRIQDGQKPIAKCFTEINVVVDNLGNASITHVDLDDNSYDNCGGPLAFTLSTYDFTAADIGNTIPVTMRVTDTSGNFNECLTQVHVVDAVTFRVNDATAATGEMKLIPITVRQFDQITSFEMDIDIANTGVITLLDIVNIHASLDGPSLIKTVTPGHGEISWIDIDIPFGLDLADGTVAFYLKVLVSGAAGTSSLININNLEVGQLVGAMPIIVPSLGIPGTLTVTSVSSSFTISGSLFERPDCGTDLVQQVNIDIDNGASILSNQPGTYSLTVPSGSTKVLTPVKNINHGNGVTAFDASIAQQYAAGTLLTPVTPYQIIAMDANNSNSVTTFDASIIHQLSAGFPITLPKSWRFIPTSTVLSANPFSGPFNESLTFTNISANHNNADFYGVKIGDVIGCNADPANLQGIEVGDRSGKKVILQIQEQALKAGTEINVTLSAVEFQEMLTCQATLNFDEQALEYLEVIPGNVSNMSLNCFNSMAAREGMLAAVWYDITPVSLSRDDVFFTVKFKALKDAKSLRELIWISKDFVTIEAIGADWSPKDVELVFEGADNNNDFSLYQNKPNPFSNLTTIGFNLPKAAHAKLIITDASGKVIKSLEGNFGVGYNQFTVDRKDLPSVGVFFYQLKTADNLAVKKMILID
jgi:hypothetical protein